MEYVEAHNEMERQAGHEISPATPLSQQSDENCSASALCANLRRDSSVLAW